MILLFGMDWAEWSTFVTVWAPIYIPDKEIDSLSRESKDIVWPHHEAAYISFPIKGLRISKNTFDLNKRDDDEEVLRKKIKGVYLFNDDQKTNISSEFRVYEDGSYTICLIYDTRRNNRACNNPFAEFAYNQENERWEPLADNYAKYPYGFIDEIERSLYLTVED